MSEVYLIDMRASSRRNLIARLDALLDAAGFKQIDWDGRLTAIKLHFGEAGNTAFIRPPYVRHVVARLKASGARPALMDANTLYRGSRSDAVAHLHTALANGFGYSAVEAPLIIADGLLGNSGVKVRVDCPELREVSLAADLVHAGALVSLAHFKLHELTGFGGALKNIGMGGADRAGKLLQHSSVRPLVDADKCSACGDCAAQCNFAAIDLPAGGKAFIDPQRCSGCGGCIVVCPLGAIGIKWDSGAARCQKRMAEHALGLLKNKAGRALFVNFITDVSPACDCYSHNDAAIVPDIGVAASRDPVALDHACMDLVNQAEGLRNSELKSAHAAGADKARDIYPKIDWRVQLEHGQAIGLGSLEYSLIKVR